MVFLLYVESSESPTGVGAGKLQGTGIRQISIVVKAGANAREGEEVPAVASGAALASVLSALSSPVAPSQRPIPRLGVQAAHQAGPRRPPSPASLDPASEELSCLGWLLPPVDV